MKSKKSDKTEEKPKKKSSTAVKQTKSAPAKTVSTIKKPAVRKKAAVKPTETKVAAVKVPSKVKKTSSREPEKVKAEPVSIPKSPMKAEPMVAQPSKKVEKVEVTAKSALEKKIEPKQVKVAAVKVASKVKRTKKTEPEKVKPEVISIPKLPIKAEEPVTQPLKKIEKVEALPKAAPEKKAETKDAKVQPVETRPARPKRSFPLKIPPILLEGDAPEVPMASGPGERFSLGPRPPVEKLETEGELPEAYGTQHLILTARDPHWLYAHWDLTRDQQRKYNAFSRDGHLILRVYVETVGGKPETEIHLQPEASHWFVPVQKAGTRYVSELGYYSAAEKWTVVARSGATLTPPDKMSDETIAEFTTIPLEIPLEELFTLVKEAVQENPPLVKEIPHQRAEHPNLPEIHTPVIKQSAFASSIVTEQPAPAPKQKRKLRTQTYTAPQWTPEQEQALAEIISMDHVRRVWMGSLEITELIRRQFMKEITRKAEAHLGEQGGAPTSPVTAPGARGESIEAIFSPTKKEQRAAGKEFWFNVNAELIIYGATEADATVTIAGRTIKLRRDGSFSYRFALPDGDYELPVVAVSADQTDGRAAELKFSRSTEYRGDVGEHPQDAALKKPVPDTF